MTAQLDKSFVVTGGAGGIGMSIVARLAVDGWVVASDRSMRPWSSDRVRVVGGDCADDADAVRAVAAANEMAPLAGWVNNAAVFQDAMLSSADSAQILDAITANLAMTVVGARAATQSFRSAGREGSIVNISSHQAQRPIRGALPYATAKAAIEGLTRAVAVDHGPDGIRYNAVALGSISTDRYEAYRSVLGLDPEAAG